MRKQTYEVVETSQNQQKNRFKQALKIGTATALVAIGTQSAHADIQTIGAGLTGQIDAGKAIIVGLMTAGAILLGIFAGYRYLKKGANSA